MKKYFLFLFAAFLHAHFIAPATASNAMLAEGTRSSPFATFFSAGISSGKIEIVQFPSNVNCSNGRELASPERIREAMLRYYRPLVQRNLAEEAARANRPAPTEVEIQAKLEQALRENRGDFCGPTLRGYHFKAENPQALLLVVHGMQSNSAWFLSGEELAANGIEVLAFDRRGSGISDGFSGHAEDFNEIINDMDAAVEYLRNNRLNLPMHLHANCFGTRIAVPYLQDYMETRTRARLQEKKKRENPNISPELLDDINGYRFVSIINTSPATHMSRLSERSIRDNLDCFMQFVQADKSWEPREKCLAKPLESYPIMQTEFWQNLLSSEEKSCLQRFAQRYPDSLKEAECRPQHLQKLFTADCLSTDPTTLAHCQASMSEAEQNCLDGLAWQNNSYFANDKCSAAARAALKAEIKDPTGVEMVRSPLTDDLFTTEPRFLQMIREDATALRALSRTFFYALYELSNRMDAWMKGRIFDNQVVNSALTTPILMVLANRDLMVENDEIVHEVFTAHRGESQTQSGDLLDKCYRCNPRVVSQVDANQCNAAELKSCQFPQDVVECVDPAGEIAPCLDKNGNAFSCQDPSKPFQQCADVRLLSPPEVPDFHVPSKTIKRLVEIDCEHFMEFCQNPAETHRYRRAMIDWLKQPRWQAAWEEYFE